MRLSNAAAAFSGFPGMAILIKTERPSGQCRSVNVKNKAKNRTVSERKRFEDLCLQPEIPTEG